MQIENIKDLAVLCINKNKVAIVTKNVCNNNFYIQIVWCLFTSIKTYLQLKLMFIFLYININIIIV